MLYKLIKFIEVDVCKDLRGKISNWQHPSERTTDRPRTLIPICRKIEVPSFHSLSELITAEINALKRQLVKFTELLLTEKVKRLLDQLIESNDESATKIKYYNLTLIKTFSHSLQPSTIKSNIEQHVALRELYS